MGAPHVAFVDANLYGLAAVELAVRSGCSVTFLRSTVYGPLYESSEAYGRVAAAVDRVVPFGDPSDHGQVWRALRDIHERHRLDAVVAMLDVVVESVAEAADRLGIPFTPVVGVRRARHKGRCHRRLAECGLPVPRHVTVAAREQARVEAERVGYPLVFKPSSGAGSLGCAVVGDPAELAAAWDRLDAVLADLPPTMAAAYCPDVVLEEHLDGPLLSVEIAATADGAVPLGVLERKRGADETVELGSLAPARLAGAQRARVEGFAARALAALGLDLGVFHLEMILTADGPRLIDPNLRMIGGPGALLIGNTWGFDAYRTLLAVHLGWPVEAPAREPVRFGTTHLLAPAAPGVWGGAEPTWLDAMPEVTAWRLRVRPGTPVRPIASGFEYLGFVMVHAGSREESMARCDEVVDRIAAEAGVPLLTWAP